MACDLHIHSDASDGGFTPVQVVEHASHIGLSCISLTDHDTFDGIDEAARRARELSLPFIPGIEMTAVLEQNEIHILGYFADCSEEKICKALVRGRSNTVKRLTYITEKLTRLGYPVDIAEVEEISGRGSLGRPHLALIMLRKGYVKTTQEAFERYIGSEGPAYVPPIAISPREVYQLIRGAGGIPAIAHPGLPGRADMMGDNEIAVHREWGAEAIEVFHPRHDDYMTGLYLKLARKFNMAVVGGSDCHGPYYPHILMDRKKVPDWVAEKFISYHESQRGSVSRVPSRQG